MNDETTTDGLNLALKPVELAKAIPEEWDADYARDALEDKLGELSELVGVELVIDEETVDQFFTAMGIFETYNPGYGMHNVQEMAAAYDVIIEKIEALLEEDEGETDFEVLLDLIKLPNSLNPFSNPVILFRMIAEVFVEDGTDLVWDIANDEPVLGKVGKQKLDFFETLFGTNLLDEVDNSPISHKLTELFDSVIGRIVATEIYTYGSVENMEPGNFMFENEKFTVKKSVAAATKTLITKKLRDSDAYVVLKNLLKDKDTLAHPFNYFEDTDDEDDDTSERISALESQIEELANDRIAQEAHIVSLDSQIAESNKALDKARATITEREAEIARLESLLSDRDSQLKEFAENTDYVPLALRKQLDSSAKTKSK